MATTGIASAFTPGIENHYFIELAEYPPYWHDFMHFKDMDTAYIDDQGYENYGIPVRRSPGSPVQGGRFLETFNKRYVPDTYSLGDSIPQEDLNDDMYDVIHRQLPAKGGGFARMFRVLTELQVAGMFQNFGYVSGTVLFGSDGVSLFNTGHPVSRSNSANNWANRPSVDVDLSIASYNAMYTNIVSQPGPNNIEIIENMPRHLVVNQNQRTIAIQICQGDWQPNTVDRNMNVVKRDNVMPVVWPYFRKSGLTGATVTPQAYNSWFVVGRDHYLKFYLREAFTLDTDSDINTRSQLFAGHIRFAYGWSDARGCYGSLGL